MGQSNVNLPFLMSGADGPMHLDITLSQAKFEELTKPLLDRCVKPFESALKDAGLKMADLDEVVLVGGSTRMPLVQELIKKMTGKEPRKGVNPDEVVAAGAAIQASVLTGEQKGMVLIDVTPLSLGVETQGGIMTVMIERNTRIPCEHTEVYTTAQDFQPSVEVKVLQGERPMARDNRVARHVPTGRNPARTEGNAPDRGELRGGRKRDPPRRRAGQGVGQKADGHDHGFYYLEQGRH